LGELKLVSSWVRKLASGKTGGKREVGRCDMGKVGRIEMATRPSQSRLQTAPTCHLLRLWNILWLFFTASWFSLFRQFENRLIISALNILSPQHSVLHPTSHLLAPQAQRSSSETLLKRSAPLRIFPALRPSVLSTQSSAPSPQSSALSPKHLLSTLCLFNPQSEIRNPQSEVSAFRTLFSFL
jgi:hypothetical protein